MHGVMAEAMKIVVLIRVSGVKQVMWCQNVKKQNNINVFSRLRRKCMKMTTP